MSAGQLTIVDTVLNYMDKLQAGMVLSEAERYDIRGKNILASTEKYYVGNIGLRNVSKASEQMDTSKLLENLEKIDDNYPKYVISSDILDMSKMASYVIISYTFCQVKRSCNLEPSVRAVPSCLWFLIRPK